MRYSYLVFLLAAALLASVPWGPAQAEEFAAGFLDLQLVDPVEGGSMPAVVFYPTRADAGTTQVGPFTIAAVRGASPAAGAFPLIVHSHGTGGTHLGHHDTLTALARAGFVAAAVQHPRDNFLDTSGFATDLQLIGRPHHIVALIDGVLADGTVGPLVDKGRVGMAGFSAGGYTALLVAGAVPDFALREAYRKAVPNDPLRRRADAAAAKGRRKPDLKFVADPRVKAIFVMAPALGYLFDRAGPRQGRGAGAALPAISGRDPRPSLECRAHRQIAAEAPRVSGGRGRRPLRLPAAVSCHPGLAPEGHLQGPTGHRSRSLP